MEQRIKLYKHQQKFIDANPDRAVLNWEMGTGKTLAILKWLEKRSDTKSLVIVPKAILKRWTGDTEYLKNTKVTTRDQMKQEDLSVYDTIVCDEAHDYFSPLFNKQRSIRATKLYNAIKDKPETNLLMATATPIRSSPYNLHTMLCFLGNYIPIKKFTNDFFYLTDMFGRWHYEPVKDWRIKIRPYIEKYTDIVLLSDCVDIPNQEHIKVSIKVIAKKKDDDFDEYNAVAKDWHEKHREENGIDKYKKLEDIVNGYHKCVVVAYYRDQIEDYAERLRKEHTVYVLHGGVSDQDGVIKQARKDPQCVFIVQAGMGVGFELPEFSVMIFASMSFKFVDYVQMLGRIKRINALHENTHYYLLAGACDRNVYNKVLKGLDFHPPHYLKK